MLAAVTLALCVHTPAIAAKAKTVDIQASISDLREAYRKGNFNQFTTIADQIPRDSLFAPYVDIWLFRLVQDPQGQDDENEGTIWRSKEVKALLERHDNTWAAEELRRDWLQQLARIGLWQEYRAQRPALHYRPDQGVECADMLYALHQGQFVRDEIMGLLSAGDRLPRTCRVFLRALYDKKVISADDLNLRIYYLVAANHLTNAQKFVNDFNDTDWGKSVPQSTLKKASFSPEKYLRDVRKGKSISNISIAAALTRLAVKDSDKALRELENRYAKHLTKHARKWLAAFIAYRSALNWDSEAEARFADSSLDVMGPELLEWRVRAALINEDYKAVQRYIEQMPETLRKDETWQYWKGRALSAQGQVEQARLVWISIAQPFSFYGKLALEELGNTLAPPERPRPVTADELRKAKANKGLQRSLAFYDAGLRYEGFREFNLQTENMTDRELLAAATWANNNQLYDRAIAAADRTRNEHDLALRYLTPFRSNMKVKTDEIGIEEAWVYGVIRQESRFVSIARSHVGANGLMQVMPSTAKYVARKIGLKGFRLSEVNKIDTNLTLGTSYLKMVSEGLDNSPVMASAGYNAGPSRPKRWRDRLTPGRNLEGALFAELIPFDETRTYVKNVMSNTVAYSLLLRKESTPLKQRLGTIRGSD